MKRVARFVAVLIALQGAFIGIYILVESSRVDEAADGELLGVEPPRRVDVAMPRLVFQTRKGGQVELRSPKRPTLVHFWATWCPPCRGELPGLLALPDEHQVEVVAVALDENWADVERFLGGDAGSQIVLGDTSGLERALGVRELPVTLLLQPNGRISLRFNGARDWSDEAFVKSWIGELKDH